MNEFSHAHGPMGKIDSSSGEAKPGFTKVYSNPEWRAFEREPGAPMSENVPVARDLMTGEPINPWEEKLQVQGINLELPARFQDISKLPEGTHLDSLTGLAIEDGEIKLQVVNRLTQAILNDEDWALYLFDSDNLKAANTKHKRQFGDVVIRQGIVQGLNYIDSMNFPPEAEIFALRQTSAADECVVDIFNAPAEKLHELKEKQYEAERKTIIADPEFTFSLSGAVITSDDENVQAIISSSREYLNEHPGNLALDAYEAIKELADTEVKFKKTAKDIERLPVNRLLGAKGVDEVINVIVEDLGGTRIGEELLRHSAEVQRFEDIASFRNAFPDSEAFIQYSLEAGHPFELLRHFNEENPRVSYYNSLIR